MVSINDEDDVVIKFDIKYGNGLITRLVMSDIVDAISSMEMESEVGREGLSVGSHVPET